MSEAFWITLTVSGAGAFANLTVIVTAVIAFYLKLQGMKEASEARAATAAAELKAVKDANDKAVLEAALGREDAKQKAKLVAVTNARKTNEVKEEVKAVGKVAAQAVDAVAEVKDAVADVAVTHGETAAALANLKGGPDSEHLKEQAKSYEEIAIEAVANLRAARDEKFRADGKEIPPRVVAVVPEHSSPTTKKQRETAALQTVRAELTELTLQLGLPAREASQDADEEKEN